MPLNRNQFGILLGVAGGLFGLVVGIASIFMPKASEQTAGLYIFIVLSVVILILLAAMIFMLVSKYKMERLMAPIFLIFIAIIVFAALSVFGELYPDQPAIKLFKNIENWQYAKFILPVIFLLSIGPALISLLSYAWYNFFTREKLLKTGIAGTAKILKQTDFGMSFNDQPIYQLTLEVTIPGQQTYTVTKDFWVPTMDIPNIRVGNIVPVKVHPNNPQKVAIDTWTGNVPS